MAAFQDDDHGGKWDPRDSEKGQQATDTEGLSKGNCSSYSLMQSHCIQVYLYFSPHQSVLCCFLSLSRIIATHRLFVWAPLQTHEIQMSWVFCVLSQNVSFYLIFISHCVSSDILVDGWGGFFFNILADSAFLFLKWLLGVFLVLTEVGEVNTLGRLCAFLSFLNDLWL